MNKELNELLMQTPDISDVQPAAAIDPATVAAESDTVLHLDDWSKRQGQSAVESWTEQGAAEVDAIVAADACGSLFEPSPRLAERPADLQRAAWWKQLMETPEFQGLRAQTVLDPLMSSIGAKTICDQWTAYSVAESERRGPEGDSEGLPGSDEESVESTVARLQSTASAIAAASDAVDEAKATAAGLGMGDDGQPIDPKQLAAAFKRIRDNDVLQSMIALAGRMRSRARSLQRQKVSSTRGEVTGVHLSNDIGAALPAELAAVAGVTPELEMLALLRYSQQRLLTYKHHAPESVQAGPIVVVVDESGSMGGEPIIAAKALALTMAWIARHQKRWIALVGFSGGEEGHHVAFPPDKFDEAKLMDWLVHFYGGGTTCDVPLQQLPFEYWQQFIVDGLQRGRTDVILITDACLHVPDEVSDNYVAWAKHEQVKTYTIVIGDDDAGDLNAVSERVWCIDNLDMDQDCVEELLSI